MLRRDINSRFLGTQADPTSPLDPWVVLTRFARGAWQPDTQATVTDVSGVVGAMVFTDFSSVASVDRNGRLFQSNTAGTTGSAATLRSAGNVAIYETNPQMVHRFKLPDIADIRTFAGISTSFSNSDMVLSDSPAATYVGVQFSTARADANYQIVHSPDGGASQFLLDTGVAVVALEFALVRITITSSDIAVLSMTVELEDEAGTTLANETITTNLPGPSTGAKPWRGIATLVNLQKTYFDYGGDWINRSQVAA